MFLKIIKFLNDLPIKVRQRMRTQSGKNIFFSAGGALANPVLQIVALPILFKRLGAENFGIWALINAVIATSGIANLGLGDAATKYVAKHRARGEAGNVINIIRSVLMLYLVLGAFAAIVVTLGAPWIAEYGFKIGPDHLPFVVSALRVAAVGIVLEFAYGVMESTVRGFDRYDVESKWGTFNSVFSTIAAIICAKIGAGLVVILVTGIVIQAVALGGLACAVRRFAKTWRFLEPGFDRASMKEVFSFGIFTWFQALNGMVLQQLDRFVIGASLGAAAAGYYSVCLQLVQTAHVVLARASAFVFPLVVRYTEEKRGHELWKIFKQGMFITTLAGWFMSGGILVFGGNFLTLWMGTAFAQNALLPLQILAIWTAFLATTVIQCYFLNATGNEKLNTVLGASSSGFFVVAAFALIPSLGVTGAALARLASFLPALIATGIILKKCFDERRRYVGLLVLLPTGTAVALTELLQNSRITTSPAEFALKIALFGGATCACAFTSWLVYVKILCRDDEKVEPEAFVGPRFQNAP